MFWFGHNLFAGRFQFKLFRIRLVGYSHFYLNFCLQNDLFRKNTECLFQVLTLSFHE